MTSFSFTIEARDGAARQGEIATPRGAIRTLSLIHISEPTRPY